VDDFEDDGFFLDRIVRIGWRFPRRVRWQPAGRLVGGEGPWPETETRFRSLTLAVGSEDDMEISTRYADEA